MAPLEYRQLGSTDMKVSSLSFGASSLGSVFHATQEEESVRVVHDAIKLGINYIDTAPWYGQGKSETVLGKALRGLDRKDYFLSTKVGRYEKEPVSGMFDFSAERTMRSVDESLARLGVDYVDIIQIHDMEFAPSLDIVINETLPALQKVQASGKARYIGITGYPLENFRKVLDRSKVPIDTILTYCRYSMNDRSLLEYMPYFKSVGVGVINASPLSMGLLTHRGPPDWHPAKPHIKQACWKAAAYCQENGVDISRLAMSYSHACSDVVTTLFSTSSIDNLKRSVDSSVAELSQKEKSVLNTVMERYFEPLNNDNWEGVEVQQYWDNMNN